MVLEIRKEGENTDSASAVMKCFATIHLLLHCTYTPANSMSPKQVPDARAVHSMHEAIIGAILLIGIRWPGDLRQFSWTEFVEQINFGLSLYLARLANYAMRNLDRWIIGRTLGPQTLGYFSRANQTVSTIESIFWQKIGRINLAGV